MQRLWERCDAEQSPYGALLGLAYNEHVKCCCEHEDEELFALHTLEPVL